MYSLDMPERSHVLGHRPPPHISSVTPNLGRVCDPIVSGSSRATAAGSGGLGVDGTVV